MVIAKIREGGKVSSPLPSSRKDTKRVAGPPLHSRPYLLFLAGVKACPFLLSISGAGWFETPPRFFITIYSRTSGTSSYAALLRPDNSPRGRLIGPDFEPEGYIDFKRTPGQMVRTLLSQPKVGPTFGFISRRSGRVEWKETEPIRAMAPNLWPIFPTSVRICEPRLIGKMRKKYRRRKEARRFFIMERVRLRKEKFQSRINPPANGRTKRIDRAKPIRTSTLQLDASERTEMLWPGIGRVITWLNSNHGPFYPRPRLWTRRADIHQLLSPDQTYEYSPILLLHLLRSRTTVIYLFSYNLSLLLRISYLIFLPRFFFLILRENFVIEINKQTNASRLSYREIENFRLPCARAEYKRRSSLGPVSPPLSERTEIIQNFLAVKPNWREGRGWSTGVRETEHPYFSVKYHRDQVLMLRAGIQEKPRISSLLGSFPTRARLHVERRVQHPKPSISENERS